MNTGPHAGPTVLLQVPSSPLEAVWEKGSPFTSPVNPLGAASPAMRVNTGHAVDHTVNGALASHENHGRKRNEDPLTLLPTVTKAFFSFIQPFLHKKK